MSGGTRCEETEKHDPNSRREEAVNTVSTRPNIVLTRDFNQLSCLKSDSTGVPGCLSRLSV